MAILTNPEPGRALSYQPLLGEPFALVSHKKMRIGPVVSVDQLGKVPLLMTSLHRSLVDRQLASLGLSLKVRAEIDSVDAIRDLVMRGRWASIMPVSVFRDNGPNESIVMSEISGVQLNRLLVLATRIESHPNPSLSLVHEVVVAEFARLERQGIFSFSTKAPARSTPKRSTRAARSR